MRHLLLLFGLFTLTAFAQKDRPVLLITDATDLRASVEALPELQRAGMQIRVVAGPGCFFGVLDGSGNAALQARYPDARLFDAVVNDEDIEALRPEQRIAARYLNALLNGSLEGPDALAPMDWAAHPEPHAFEQPEDAHAPAPVQGTPRGQGGNAEDWTCSVGYNAETMEGIIVASTFFVESDGSIDANTYTWPQTDIDAVKLQVIDAWSIWSYTAGLHGTTVTAVMDWYEPSGGIPVQGYEPVMRSGSSDGLWIGAIMGNLGRTEPGTFGKLHGFNHDRRGQLGADRSFSCFVAYNPSGAPTQFTDGKIGYAYLGGPYTQILWRANGWTSSQINRVYGHEVGHIFHAFDEYAASTSSNCTRKFNGETNSNYQGSTCNGTQGCVMINNAFSGSGATRQWQLCTHTPFHVGWQGLVAAPLCTAPINDSIILAVPFKLRWNRFAPPAGVSSYVKVYHRTTNALVYCGNTGSVDTLLMSLVNGPYRWFVSQGNASTSSGYAGVIGTEAWFTVSAPLNAAFQRSQQSICAGGTVNYTDQSTGAPTTWTWSFPGGVPATWNGPFPPPIEYPLPGNYAASLTVGDGNGTDQATTSTSLTVTGGLALPFSENFNSGVFPPVGWTAQSGGGTGGQGGGQGGLAWDALLEASCTKVRSAHVGGYTFTGFYGSPTLKLPRLDLTQSTMPYLRFTHSYAQRGVPQGGWMQVSANNCSYSVYDETYYADDSVLATNGGAVIANAAWMPATCADWRSTVLPLDPLAGEVTEITFRFSVYGPDQDLHLDDVEVFEGVRVKSRVLLEGPFVAQSGLMRDDLRAQGMLPLSEPYSALGMVWYGNGGDESTTTSVLAVTGSDAIVDWVVLEARDPLDATRILASRAALLQRDGDIVDTDGTSDVRMAVPAGNYFLSVRHRNHLPVCTAAPVFIGPAMALVDLSLPATATWGTDARRIVAPYAMLWGGDVHPDRVLRYTGANNDRDAILLRIGGTIPTATMSGYLPEDNNLDGTVKYTGSGNDRDIILQNIGGVVPTNTRQGQLP